ncbi:transcriptional repressor [Borealophlyctis nickersoniae]|nr:transcriptional repressor [Borealophlyctis nickersoniae]
MNTTPPSYLEPNITVGAYSTPYPFGYHLNPYGPRRRWPTGPDVFLHSLTGARKGDLGRAGVPDDRNLSDTVVGESPFRSIQKLVDPDVGIGSRGKETSLGDGVDEMVGSGEAGTRLDDRTKAGDDAVCPAITVKQKSLERMPSATVQATVSAAGGQGDPSSALGEGPPILPTARATPPFIVTTPFGFPPVAPMYALLHNTEAPRLPLPPPSAHGPGLLGGRCTPLPNLPPPSLSPSFDVDCGTPRLAFSFGLSSPFESPRTTPVPSPSSGHSSGPPQRRPTQQVQSKKPLRKRHECRVDSCQKTFATAGHLSRHMRIHDNIKPFKCPHQGCESKFTRQDNMRQHYKTHFKGRADPDPLPTSLPTPFPKPGSRASERRNCSVRPSERQLPEPPPSSLEDTTLGQHPSSPNGDEPDQYEYYHRSTPVTDGNKDDWGVISHCPNTGRKEE